MNNNERVNFYLGEKLVNGEFKQNEKKMTIADLLNNNNTSKLYDIPLKLLLIKTNNQNKCFDFAVGDIEEQKNELVLSKNRCNENKDSVILRCLNFDRHWKHYYDKPRDIPFENKKNFVFWRGTTTGQTNRDANRFILVEKWFNKNCNIDVGFSHICQNKENYQKYVKGKCDISKFLEYKYIISVEGNDKDSGLNWKLNSNSLVLMPKPRVTSWLMETTLISDYHYVLLKDDFSDLYDKFKWCVNHQNKCKEIIKNANIFMNQFSDNKKEEQLEINVINKYFEIITPLQN
jgi:hypothetical protein